MENPSMVNSNQELLLLQVRSPFLNCYDNGHALFLIGGKALILSTDRFAKVSHRMATLHQHNIETCITSISLHN